MSPSALWHAAQAPCGTDAPPGRVPVASKGKRAEWESEATLSTSRLRRLGATGDTATRSRAGRPPNGHHANIRTGTCKLVFFVFGGPWSEGYSGDMVGWLCASASTLPFRLIHTPGQLRPLHSPPLVPASAPAQPGLNLVTSIPAQRCPFLTLTPFFSPDWRRRSAS